MENEFGDHLGREVDLRMPGMRRRLVHDYDRIDHDVVWDTASKDLSPLVEALERIVGPTN